MKRRKFLSRISRTGPPCQVCGVGEEGLFKVFYCAPDDIASPDHTAPMLVLCPTCAIELSDRQMEHLLLEAPEYTATLKVEH
jgi:hypothetical protein